MGRVQRFRGVEICNQNIEVERPTCGSTPVHLLFTVVVANFLKALLRTCLISSMLLLHRQEAHDVDHRGQLVGRRFTHMCLTSIGRVSASTRARCTGVRRSFATRARPEESLLEPCRRHQDADQARFDPNNMLISAAEVMRERGAAGVTIDEVLARSGAPRGSVYYHFPEGRNQILTEALQYAGEAITDGHRLRRRKGRHLPGPPASSSSGRDCSSRATSPRAARWWPRRSARRTTNRS